MQFWKWILDRLPALTIADAELDKFNKVSTTRFFNMSLHNHSMAFASMLDMDEWEKFAAPWIDVIGEGGWQTSYAAEIEAIGSSLNVNVPKPPATVTLPKKSVSRPPRAMVHSFGPNVIERYECVHLLTVPLVEWRYVDQKARPRAMKAIAFYIFVAHKWYERVMKHMLSIELGRTLREEFMEFLDEHWKVPRRAASSAQDKDKTDTPPGAGPSQGITTVTEALTTRRQWDKAIVDRILSKESAPTKSRSERIALRDLAERRERWHGYATVLKQVTKAIAKSPMAHYLPSEKDIMEGQVGEALENLFSVCSTVVFVRYADTHARSVGTHQQREPR